MADRILVVDDDVETLRLVSLMLQRQGYDVLNAHNGTEAINSVHNNQPDIIILDVMMPDMDGFEVTRRLRAQPLTATIPILMFTAKSQVEDKVTGYEAGVDDYLTKPVHPAELVAHIKALLTRTRTRATPAANRGHVIGVVAPRGGLGTSTMVLNLAIGYVQKTSSDIIAAELRPGHGTWTSDLDFTRVGGLCKLLSLKIGDLNPEVVEKELLRTTYGVRLLTASNDLRDVSLAANTPQLETVINHLATLSPLVLLDIGACFLANYDQILSLCSEIILITEPYPAMITSTKNYLGMLKELGFGKSKLLRVIMSNRVRADVQLSVTQVQEELGIKIAQVIPPAPEIAFQATRRKIPIIQAQPDGLIAQQFNRLAEMLIEDTRV